MNHFPTREPAPRPPTPRWGRLTEDGRVALVVRFVVPGRTFSFPYQAFIRWDLEAGEPETLTVHTSAVRVVVRGRKLAAIRDALDGHRLELLQTTTERPANAASAEPSIRTITLEPQVENR